MVTADVFTVAGSVADPELPVVTIADLGILRQASSDGDTASITITPTYSGCPAMETIRGDIVRALSGAGFTNVEIHTVYAPAWTTDWITETGKAKLNRAGIAPPGAISKQSAPPGAVNQDPSPTATSKPGAVNERTRLRLLPVAAPHCPRCESGNVEELSRFGPTACTALWRCLACLEPFEHMKAH